MSVLLRTTHGPIKIQVEVELVPAAGANFLALCASGAYDGTAFHRLVPGFVVQGGDPTGTGKGGESAWGDPFPDEFHASLRHNARGVVSFANKGPNTNRAQFFITFAAAAHLDNVYTAFGRVIDGFDTLDKIEKVPVNGTKPAEDVRILKATVLANPLADAKPTLDHWSTLRRAAPAAASSS